MKEVLSFFSNLKILNVIHRRPGISFNIPISEVSKKDVKVANVKEWKVACPQLTSVTVTDEVLLINILKSPSHLS